MYIRFIESYIAKLSSLSLWLTKSHFILFRTWTTGYTLHTDVLNTDPSLSSNSKINISEIAQNLCLYQNIYLPKSKVSDPLLDDYNGLNWKKVCKYDVNFPIVPNCNTCVKISAISLAVILLNRTLSAIQIYFRKIFLYTG